MRKQWIRMLAAAAVMLGLASTSPAVIMVLIPLSDIADKEQHIFIAKVGEVLPDRPAMVLLPVEDIKGKTPFDRMPINLEGNEEAKKNKHTAVLLDRVERDLPIVVITSKRGGRYIAYCFTNGTWFSMIGRIDKENDREAVRWSFQCCEPYLRRTFKGSTAELKQVLADAVAKKKMPPAPNDKEPPGFGEPIKKKSSLPGGIFPPLAVVQLPFIGLIAGLAALFPTVFGGLALFMKRWVAALSIGGFVSIFVCLPLFMPAWTGRQWSFSASGLWVTAAGFFALGAVWSIRRYASSFARGVSESMQPRKFDRIFALVLFLSGVVALAIGFQLELPVWSNDYWRWVLAGTAGFGAASAIILTHWRKSRNEADPAAVRVAPESALLWVLTACCLIYGSYEAGKYSSQGLVKGGGGVGQPTVRENLVWKFEPDLGGMVVNTCATQDRVFAALLVREGFGMYGRVYALDAATGVPAWNAPFDNDYEKDSEHGMKPAFSAPVYANGRLYFGEGLHTDTNSRLFCLNAATGEKLWEYKTESHTESTPEVADGKVVFGAGYHGIHCLDAATGDLLWRYPKTGKASDKALHVDCNPIIANGRVYAGSGYKPEYVARDGKVNTIFCLDLATGEPIWSERVEDAVYGSPVYHDGRVYFGTGNSTFKEKFKSKRPGVQCRDAATGAEIWHCSLKENVLGRPVCDRRQLFAGCLDGKAYAIDLRTGQVNWEIEMGGKVLAGPVADIDAKTGYADVVYFASESGNVAAVSPYSGQPYWSLPLQYWSRQPVGELSATPSMIRIDEPKLLRHRLVVGFGQGRSGETTPKLYCIEDFVKKSAD